VPESPPQRSFAQREPETAMPAAIIGTCAGYAAERPVLRRSWGFLKRAADRALYSKRGQYICQALKAVAGSASTVPLEHWIWYSLITCVPARNRQRIASVDEYQRGNENCQGFAYRDVALHL